MVVWFCAKDRPCGDSRFVFPEARCGSEGKFSTSTNAIWSFLWFPLLRTATLTLVLPVKGELQLPEARKSAFPHSETKKTRPYRSEGALWGKSSFRLFIFQMSDHSCVARCALSHDHVNFSVEGEIDVYTRTELDESQVVV